MNNLMAIVQATSYELLHKHMLRISRLFHGNDKAFAILKILSKSSACNACHRWIQTSAMGIE